LKFSTEGAPLSCCSFVGADLVAVPDAKKLQDAGHRIVIPEREREALALVQEHLERRLAALKRELRCFLQVGELLSGDRQ
jgi:hypothetical protein